MRRWLIPGVIALSAVGAFIVPFVMTARFEPALTLDSPNFLSTAENLRLGEGLRDQSLRPLLSWPPGYPAMLALINVGGLSLTNAVRLINGASFAFIVFISGMWLYRRAARRWLAAAVAVTLLFSVALLRIAAFAWSDLLFAALALGCMVFVERFLKTRRQADLIVAAGFGAAAGMVRYAGIAVVVAGTIAVWLLRNAHMRRSELVFAGIAGSPLILWLVRNQLVHGSFTGLRVATESSAATSILRLLETIGGWFLPLGLPKFILIVVTLGLLGLAAVSLLGAGREAQVAVPLFFALTYMGFALLAAMVIVMDPIHNRFLTPAVAPLLLGLAASADRFRSVEFPVSDPIGRHRAAGMAALAVVLLVLVRSVGFGVRYVPTASRTGQRGALNGPGSETALSEWVADYRPPWKIYSNFPEKLYAQAHVRGVLAAPSNAVPGSLSGLKRTVRKEEALLVWYIDTPYQVVPLAALRKELAVKILAVQADGVAYLVGPAAG
jgi:hypothetical protein